ncbi:MAG: hypothetical protein IPN75_13570 [Dechloromonas sp.]|uniref:YjeF C-terminal domain-containing protein n=1 Tax=Candidatus Dechloromonas phosphorivorans TaxID=2899244 RepID=A0A9D7LNY9_9RHOO|nr:hypothetical protein [Candidatus Dechloromonas phosphorivorans]
MLLQTDLQALACGPGLGRSAEALRLLEQSLNAPVQLLLDADALNLLADDGRIDGRLYNRVGPTIPDPAPAEAARLLIARSAKFRATASARPRTGRALSQPHCPERLRHSDCHDH